jgi:hypothetical protein
MPATKVVYSSKVGIGRPSNFDQGPGNLVAAQGIYEYSTTKKHRIGSRLQVGERIFRYALNSSVALRAGSIVSSPLLGGATTTVQVDLSLAVAAKAGDSRLYVAMDTTAQAADKFADGWVGVQDEVNADAHIFQIKTHPLIANSGTSSYIDLYDGVPADLAITSTELDLIANPYSGVIITPKSTTPACMTLGVAPIYLAGAYYFWLQTWGPAFVWNDDEVAVVCGMPACVSDNVDGAAELYEPGASGAFIGQGMLVASAVSEPVMIYLQIAA